MDYFFVGPDDILVHLALDLFLDRRNRNQRPHQLRLENPLFLLLGEIVDTVFFVELVVGLHQPLYDVNKNTVKPNLNFVNRSPCRI